MVPEPVEAKVSEDADPVLEVFGTTDELLELSPSVFTSVYVPVLLDAVVL